MAEPPDNNKNRPTPGILIGRAAVSGSSAPGSSKMLQIFLFAAFLVTAAAYVVDQSAQESAAQAYARRPTDLRKLVQAQSNALLHRQKGEKALAAHQIVTAVSEFRLAVESLKTPDGYESLGRALLLQGNPDEAFAQFQEAVHLNPMTISAYEAWGTGLASRGKPEDAARIYESGLLRSPADGSLHCRMAQALAAMRQEAVEEQREAESAGRPKEAAAAAEKSQRLLARELQHDAQAEADGVTSVEFWSDYGKTLNDAGKFSDAAACLQRAVDKNPNLSEAQFQLALAENALGHLGGAIKHYEKVLTLRPDDPLTLNKLAWLYASATNPEIRSAKMGVMLAIRACDATASQNAPFMDTLARCYAADGNFFEAIAWEEKAMRRASQLNDQKLAAEFQARDAHFLEHKAE